MLNILDDAGMLGCRSRDTPVDPRYKLREDNGEKLIYVGRYQRLVRKLIYFSLTKLNISYVIGLVSQFMHAPTIIHLEATYRILRYLKRNPGMGLLYRKVIQSEVEAYTNDVLQVRGNTDVDWAGSTTNKRSTSE